MNYLLWILVSFVFIFLIVIIVLTVLNVRLKFKYLKLTKNKLFEKYSCSDDVFMTIGNSSQRFYLLMPFFDRIKNENDDLKQIGRKINKNCNLIGFNILLIICSLVLFYIVRTNT